MRRGNDPFLQAAQVVEDANVAMTRGREICNEIRDIVSRTRASIAATRPLIRQTQRRITDAGKTSSRSSTEGRLPEAKSTRAGLKR